MRIGFIKKLSNEKYLLLTVLAVGLFLRLIGSLLVYMVFDERAWVEAARKISFLPESLNLAIHGVLHPFFEVYLIKLSTLLFPDTVLSLIPGHIAVRLSTRFLHVLLSSATIVIIYRLVKIGLGKSPAIFAVFLTAFSQFHIHFSRTVIQTAPLLFFISLSLLFFWKAWHEKNDKYIILTGVAIGLGYLCEETAVLLFLIFIIFLIISKKMISWLKKYETYAGIFIFLLIISPDLYWNATAENPDIRFHLTRAFSFNGISLLSSSLFFGELFLFFAKDLESFIGFGRHAIWSLEYPTMHWVLGVLCIAAVIYSFKKKNEFIRLMQIIFLFIFLFFSCFASSGPWKNFNFWWASIAFIPAVVLASDMLSDIFHRAPWSRWFPAAFVLYLFFHSIYFLTIEDNIYVRRPSFLTKIYLNRGRISMLRSKILPAIGQLQKALKYDSASLPAIVNLAECYQRNDQPDRAEIYWEKAGKISGASYSDLRSMRFDTGYITKWMISGYYRGSDPNPSPIASISTAKNSLSDRFISEQTTRGKWRKFDSPSAFIDLKKLLKNPPKTLSYAAARIYSPTRQEVRLLIGMDDGLTLWLNQEKIYENNQNRWWYPDEATVKTVLIKGWNEFILKVSYNGGELFGFSIRITDAAGNIMDRLQQNYF